MTRIRLAHLSDPHLGPLPRPGLTALASKRIFGYLNWLKNRRHALGDRFLGAIMADIAAQSPDHVCVTGDLVNIALPAEFDHAADWLDSIGPPDTVSVVPGNHDAYVPGAVKRAAAAWAPNIAGEGGAGFPYCRRLGHVALFGVSTAVATPPLCAGGRVGPQQLAALSDLLDRHDDAFKVVMIHHPPDAALASGRRGLADVADVREVLAAGCVDIILHGHNHTPSLAWLETPRGRAAIIGVPSASSDGRRYPLAGYALIDIDPQRNTARLTRRGFRSAEGGVKSIESIDLNLSPALD
ncbi:metallophosphoesterase family protein [Acuticoccus kandeliae]|uniref:metallophosphoesterase family protein n=1 Tax=Acuticoccus kandeliae TaxID=2073160 RepID=UPI000D3E1411|nr:metallophosphoesterase [Acuticoccus kandeliae]